jgi:hypothetical protein
MLPALITRLMPLRPMYMPRLPRTARIPAIARLKLPPARHYAARPTYRRSPYQGYSQPVASRIGFLRRLRPDVVVYSLIGVRLVDCLLLLA